MRDRWSRLEALGRCLPSRAVSSAELLAGSAVPVDAFERVTGVRRRLMCGPESGNAPDGMTLAVGAARDALSRSRYAADDLDVVISTAIIRTGPVGRLVFEPAMAHGIARRIGATRAVCFDVTNACAGMLTGVLLLDAMIRAGTARRGVVVSGEQVSLIVGTAVREASGMRDPQLASLTVGDSGMAALFDESASPDDRVHYVRMHTSARHADLCVGMPSDRGAGLAMYTDGHRQQTDERFVWPQHLDDFLARRGGTFAEEGFTHIVQHQVTVNVTRRLTAVGERHFGRPMPRELTTVEEYGNTGSTTLFLALFEHLRSGAVPPGSKILMVPAASGIVFGFLALSIADLRV